MTPPGRLASPPPTMRRTDHFRSRARVRPFRQGDLDGLCGLYAIVNAMRQASRDCAVAEEVWADLFAALVLAADDHVGIAEAVVNGIDRRPLTRILNAAIQHMADRHDLRFTVKRPLHHRAKPSIEETLACIQSRVNGGGFGGAHGPRRPSEPLDCRGG